MNKSYHLNLHKIRKLLNCKIIIARTDFKYFNRELIKNLIN